LSPYPAWALLNFQARQHWSDIFPDGKIPIKTIPTQKIAFDRYSDPESVFTLDRDALATWQQELLLEKLEKSKINLVSFGRTNFCVVGAKNTIFLKILEGYR